MNEKRDQKDAVYFVPGLAILGWFITGISSIYMSYKYRSDIALLAAAISFGFVVYVSYMKK